MAISNFISAVQRLQPSASPVRGGTVSLNRVGPVPVPVYRPPVYQPPRPVSLPSWRDDPRANDPNWSFSMAGGWQPAAGSAAGSPGSSYAVAPPPVLPQPDIAGLQAKARQAAEGAVNPYYTKQLNDFLAKQATERQIQEQQYNLTAQQAEEAANLKQKNLEESSKTRQKQLDQIFSMNLKLYEEALKQQLQQNDITKGRTIEDVGTEKANINRQADVFQKESGQQFAGEREGVARELAARGLSGGLGAQAQEALTQRKNVAEGLQEEQFTQARAERDLFQNRTLDDLMRSGELAKTKKALQEEGAKLETAQGKEEAVQAETQGKASAELLRKQAREDAKQSIDNYYALYGQSSDQALGLPYTPTVQKEIDTLEQQRQKELELKTRMQNEKIFNEYLYTLSNPQQIEQMRKTYGGFF